MPIPVIVAQIGEPHEHYLGSHPRCFGTLAVGTFVQGVHPLAALIVAAVGGLAYYWISDTIDAHCR